MLRLSIAAWLAVSATACSIPAGSTKVFADIHDGDQKQVSLSDTATISGYHHLTIKPYGNNQTWEVEGQINDEDCTVMIDFNVPGKPGFPPVPLKLTLQSVQSPGRTARTAACVFTDPSGTLADPTFPLNYWIEIAALDVAATVFRKLG